jgi:hypothetical protein
MRSLHRAGVTLAFSSDWNVAEMDPMVGLCTAVTRRPQNGGEAWIPEETVDMETAFHVYTMESAYANFLDERGSLTVGKFADLVVLSRDVLTVDPAAVPGTVCDSRPFFDARPLVRDPAGELRFVPLDRPSLGPLQAPSEPAGQQPPYRRPRQHRPGCPVTTAPTRSRVHRSASKP